MTEEEAMECKREAEWAQRQLDARGITHERADAILASYAANPLGVLTDAMMKELS